MDDTEAFLGSLFGVSGKVAVVTGGTGVLGGAMADGLAAAGARVAVLGRAGDRAEARVTGIVQAGGEALVTIADVLDRRQLEDARDAVLARWERVDILVNAAGGNVPDASTTADRSVFDLPVEALRASIELNFLGTVLPCQVFGQLMAERGGSIVNVSSMSVPRALTRVAGYGAGKAAMENFTRWLAVELTRRFGEGLRVNAIAPGFFVAEHNRDLLIRPDGRPTERGDTILRQTPMARFGDPPDLVSTLLWLCGPGARFVTGVVVPVDGGFNAFGGV